MTITRTRLWIAVVFCLVSARPSYAEDVAFTIAQPVTRVNVPPSALSDTAQKAGVVLVGNLRPAYPMCTQLSTAKAGSGDESFAPDELKLRLVGLLERRTVAQVQTLITAIVNESDPVKKFNIMFLPGGALELPRAGEWKKHMGSAAQLRLRAGMEFTDPEKIDCFSAAQLDQINAEGLRVIRVVAQGLAPAGQAAQKPVAPGGLGIQKPQ